MKESLRQILERPDVKFYIDNLKAETYKRAIKKHYDKLCMFHSTHGMHHVLHKRTLDILNNTSNYKFNEPQFIIFSAFLLTARAWNAKNHVRSMDIYNRLLMGVISRNSFLNGIKHLTQNGYLIRITSNYHLPDTINRILKKKAKVTSRTYLVTNKAEMVMEVYDQKFGMVFEIFMRENPEFKWDVAESFNRIVWNYSVIAEPLSALKYRLEQIMIKHNAKYMEKYLLDRENYPKLDVKNF